MQGFSIGIFGTSEKVFSVAHKFIMNYKYIIYQIPLTAGKFGPLGFFLFIFVVIIVFVVFVTCTIGFVVFFIGGCVPSVTDGG